MAKLYFRYGTVSSAKTLNLLAVVHNYRQQGKFCILLKPATDARFGKCIVRSRAGLEEVADDTLEADDIVCIDINADCIVVDEAQFLTVAQIEELRDITDKNNIPVICYGLRSDFRSNLFPASKRLFELADDIQEIKNICYYCNKKATMNLKHIDGVPTIKGPSIQLGSEELYFPVCYSCYRVKLGET